MRVLYLIHDSNILSYNYYSWFPACALYI
jgi:hypothetical protein